nr:N-6 DNA methylase [Aurantimonas sp. CSK15Z-1]
MVRTGVLTSQGPAGTGVELRAIVCEFARPASADLLDQAHRLAWNFCHAPTLVTIDPTEIRAWTCFERPRLFMGGMTSQAAELSTVRGDLGSDISLSDQAAVALDIVSFVTGQIIEDHANRFSSDGRADRQLLENLKTVRRRLVEGAAPLPTDVAHDLIARLMFVQFLFDRKDACGRSALDADRLASLFEDGTLRHRHQGFSSILESKEETYRFFRWLNSRFNGDLFPGKFAEEARNEAEWKAETDVVKREHLDVLRDLVVGDLEIASGQTNLWRLYSFETIPLEFVSCIYEEFVSPSAIAAQLTKEASTKSTGSHYTPIYLADFVLDSVLPWTSDEWDIRIIDPACGSGVFLVRAFQRLIHRWRRANRASAVPPEILAYMLTHCVFGVDLNPHAVRVASFSLYLAMCDEIDPREDWMQVRLPSLRGDRIVAADFFSEIEGFDTEGNAERYDIVIGNAPWGKNTAAPKAREWSEMHGWQLSKLDVGSLFLAKSLTLLRTGGRLAMIQSAGTLLFHEGSVETRRRILERASIDEIVNFSILRFHLFPSAISPACSVTLTKGAGRDEPTIYVCPKLQFGEGDAFRIAIEKNDVHAVAPDEMDDPAVWTVLMTGTRRDLTLCRRIALSGAYNLQDLESTGSVVSREGVIPKGDRKEHKALAGFRYLDTRDFPEDAWLTLRSKDLPLFGATRIHRRTKPEAFASPQMIVKQGWASRRRRFRAVLPVGPATVCTQSYLSVHARDEIGKDALRDACLFINSRLAAYFLALTNGRMTYRPEPLAGDFMRLPIARFDDVETKDLPNEAALDDLVERRFSVRPSEQALIEDALEFSLPELLRDSHKPGRGSTSKEGTRDALDAYCEKFLDVLEASTGGADFCATIADKGPDEGRASHRVAFVHFARVGKSRIRRFPADEGALAESLARWKPVSRTGSGVLTGNRVATIFENFRCGESGDLVPSVMLIRPDEKRYWTRAQAMRDADDILLAGWTSGLAMERTAPEAASP